MTQDEREYRPLAAIADHLIPAAGEMPSAADVVDRDRLEFVLRARPDLAEPLRAALDPTSARTHRSASTASVARTRPRSERSS